MEEFLESVKSETKDLFRSKKNLINLLILGILILALPLSVNSLRYQQIIKSRAEADPIVFTGPNVEQRDGEWFALKPQISLEITSPLGPPGSPASPSPGPSDSPGPSPSSSPVPSASPSPSPPAGCTNTLTTTTSPGPVTKGSNITFSYSDNAGGQSSLCVGNTLTGGVGTGVPDGRPCDDFDIEYPMSRTCTTTAAGIFTWTHYWRPDTNCAAAKCQQSITYTIEP